LDVTEMIYRGDNFGSDLVWGAGAISEEVNLSPEATAYRLQQRLLPGRKIGSRWVASRKQLRAHLTGTEPEQTA